jgi:copper chaperone CopZ
LQDFSEAEKGGCERVNNYYVHHVPGRLRVRVPQVKQSPKESRNVQALLQDLLGVESVSVNPITGSVLVTYDKDMIDSNEIFGCLKDQGHFEEPRPWPNHDSSPIPYSDAQKFIGRAIIGWAVGKALEQSGLSFLTALI